MSSLMLWKIQQSLLLSLLTPNTTGYHISEFSDASDSIFQLKPYLSSWYYHFWFIVLFLILCFLSDCVAGDLAAMLVGSAVRLE